MTFPAYHQTSVFITSILVSMSDFLYVWGISRIEMSEIDYDLFGMVTYVIIEAKVSVCKHAASVAHTEVMLPKRRPSQRRGYTFLRNSSLLNLICKVTFPIITH